MYLVTKHVEGVDFQREEIIAHSNDRDMCEQLATRLNEAVRNVELFDNICSVYYLVQNIGITSSLLNQNDVDAVFNYYKEDRG